VKIDILGFQAFLSVSEQGNFQRAAAALNVSQAALSHRISKFEKDLGVQLLSRTTRRVALTRIGQDFAPRARRILDEITGSLDELRGQGMRRQEVLTLGCLPTMAASLLPRVLSEFRRRHHPISIKIYDRAAPEITELVQTGAAEVGFTVASAFGPDLDFKPLRKEPLVAICPISHPLASRRTISAADLDGAPLIRLGPRDSARILIDEAFGAQRTALMWEYEVQHGAAAMSLVAAGVGLTILPLLAIDLDRAKELIAVPLVHPKITITLGMLSRKNAPLSVSAEALVGVFKKHVLRKRR
jgi:DNA-binding transcriptional LysR family regulator